MKMIDLLNLIANDTLEDETRVIIEDELYEYDRESKKIRVAKDKNSFRIIHTEKLNTEVEVLFNLKKAEEST